MKPTNKIKTSANRKTNTKSARKPINKANNKTLSGRLKQRLSTKLSVTILALVLLLGAIFYFAYNSSGSSALSAKTYNCTYDNKTTYRVGSSSTCVKYVQAVVNGWLFCSKNTTPKLAVDGIFGQKTGDAVVLFKKAYQKELLAAGGNLEPTVGPQAWGIIAKYNDANPKCAEDANLPPLPPAVVPSTANTTLMKQYGCTYDGKTTYRSGDSTNCIKYVQAILNGWRLCSNKTGRLSITGVFDTATVASVSEFKTANEKDILAYRGTLEPVVGPQAWQVLLKYHEANQKCVTDANPSPSVSSINSQTNEDYVVLKQYACNYDGKTTYRVGDENACIKYIQAVINVWSQCSNGGKNIITINGKFDQATSSAVLAYKKANQKELLAAGGNLEPTVGPQAWAMLIAYNKSKSTCVTDGIKAVTKTTSTSRDTANSGQTNNSSSNTSVSSDTFSSSDSSSDSDKKDDTNKSGVSAVVKTTVGTVSGAITSTKKFFIGFLNKPQVRSTLKKYECKYDGKTTYKIGSEGGCVKYIQAIVNGQKYCSGNDGYLIVDGKFNSATEKEVIDFKNAMKKDIEKSGGNFEGIVGPEAWKVFVKYNVTHNKCVKRAIPHGLPVTSSTTESSSGSGNSASNTSGSSSSSTGSSGSSSSSTGSSGSSSSSATKTTKTCSPGQKLVDNNCVTMYVDPGKKCLLGISNFGCRNTCPSGYVLTSDNKNCASIAGHQYRGL